MLVRAGLFFLIELSMTSLALTIYSLG